MADPETLVPKLAGVLDDERLRALPLAGVDRFVLSLVDGRTSVAALADTVGIGVEEVVACLLKLEAMRVVALSSSSKPAPAPPAAPPPAAQPSAPRPASETDADVDLDPDHRREIEASFASLANVDHYSVLGLPREADKKAVKRAYFERTSRFHPDRFFRKKLGSYKAKMEAVFGRMTEAHDTLTSSERRAEYDAYLASVDRTRGIEDMLAEAMREMKRAEEAVDVATSAQPSPALPPRGQPSGPSQPSPNLGAFIADALDGRVPSKPPAPSAGRISVTPVRSEPPSARDRRELLARRLTGSSVRVPAAPKVPAISFTKTEDAVDALKRRYEDKVAAARTAQARKYVESGTQAREKGDMVAAANALRVALSFDPDNPALKASHEEAQRAADQLLVEQYLKQADYEERSEKWSDAGRSWARVARAQPNNSKAHERAAFCMMKADGDLHEAASLGQRAVQLEPKNPTFRRTMASVYIAAGLMLNARREIDAALQLVPDDPNALALLKRIAK